MDKNFYENEIGHKEVLTALNSLAADCPALFMTTIGSSVMGRPIPAVRIGTGEKKLLYVGCHHGAEHITSGIILRFLEELCSLYGSDKKIYGIDPGHIFNSRCIYMIPMLNPDGAELSVKGADKKDVLYERLIKMNKSEDFSHWQANARGVDLNHNYDAGFSEYKALEKELGCDFPCPSRYSGEYPESEPETAAVCNFIRVLLPFHYLFSFHTQGEEIYSGYNGKEPRGSVRAAQTLALNSGYTYTKPDSSSASYGGLKDWYIDKYSLPAFTVECGKGENPLPPSELIPIYISIRKMLFISLVI